MRRLNELGVLSRGAVITSVSGGSILNGVLAARWNGLRTNSQGIFENFDEQVASPIRMFCSTDIRTNLVLGHRLNPVNWFALAGSLLSISGNLLAKSYQPLFGDVLLRDLPDSSAHTPRFVFCATSMNTGACWQFHAGAEGRMGDFYTGYFSTGDLGLAEAVAASSAFPLTFGPFALDPSRSAEFSRVDHWGYTRPASGKRRVVKCAGFSLTDGGVYDNLGLEPVWSLSNTILCSDGGLPFESVSTCRPFLVNRLKRIAAISNEQVGAMRKRYLVDKFVTKSRVGALWGIDTIIDDYGLPEAAGYRGDTQYLLSRVRTDLNSFSQAEMACLENHGYSLADAALKSRVPQLLPDPIPAFRWPNPDWSATNQANAALQDSASRHIGRDVWNWFRSLPRRPGD
jgi:NTE family protein